MKPCPSIVLAFISFLLLLKQQTCYYGVYGFKFERVDPHQSETENRGRSPPVDDLMLNIDCGLFPPSPPRRARPPARNLTSDFNVNPRLYFPHLSVSLASCWATSNISESTWQSESTSCGAVAVMRFSLDSSRLQNLTKATFRISVLPLPASVSDDNTTFVDDVQLFGLPPVVGPVINIPQLPSELNRSNRTGFDALEFMRDAARLHYYTPDEISNKLVFTFAATRYIQFNDTGVENCPTLLDRTKDRRPSLNVVRV